MGIFDGKVALVTGAARGQGRSHARALAEEGADVIAIDICSQIDSIQFPLATPADLAETASIVSSMGRRVVAAEADVRDYGALKRVIDQAVEELDGLDTVVANAGICSLGRVEDLTIEEWQDTIDVNLTGVFNTAKASIPHLRKRGAGSSLVFTSSVFGLTAAENTGNYAAAKHGVVGLMKVLALELARESIRVNAVCPASVDTDLIHNPVVQSLYFPEEEHPTREQAAALDGPFAASHALPTPWLDPQDISNAVMFLASDLARFITGVALPVDAGFLIKKL
jgi:(+)-trans-carveol dehydrogenase